MNRPSKQMFFQDGRRSIACYLDEPGEWFDPVTGDPVTEAELRSVPGIEADLEAAQQAKDAAKVRELVAKATNGELKRETVETRGRYSLVRAGDLFELHAAGQPLTPAPVPEKLARRIFASVSPLMPATDDNIAAAMAKGEAK
jgi:hypothetical protein